MHLTMYWFFYDRSEERLEKGRAAAQAAARLGSDLPESHDALGFLYYWGSRDYARAIAAGSFEMMPRTPSRRSRSASRGSSMVQQWTGTPNGSRMDT